MSESPDTTPPARRPRFGVWVRNSPSPLPKSALLLMTISVAHGQICCHELQCAVSVGLAARECPGSRRLVNSPPWCLSELACPQCSEQWLKGSYD